MRITVKDSTPERAREFACTLSTALRRPVFKRNTDQIDTNDTVLEFDAKYKELETVQDVTEGTAEQMGVQIWFWTYKKSIRRTWYEDQDSRSPWRDLGGCGQDIVPAP